MISANIGKVIAMYCIRCFNNTYRKVDIDDSQEYTRSSATPSTAAHGDVENPYETVNTVRFHPIQSSEDTTSAKNNNSKDPKKVFYTKVNPNFNPGEEIEVIVVLLKFKLISRSVD